MLKLKTDGKSFSLISFEAWNDYVTFYVVLDNSNTFEDLDAVFKRVKPFKIFDEEGRVVISKDEYYNLQEIVKKNTFRFDTIAPVAIGYNVGDVVEDVYIVRLLKPTNDEKISMLEQDVVATMMALADVYEMLTAIMPEEE